MGGTPGGERDLIRPMLATLARELPPDVARWAAELKWDGMRAIAYLSVGQVQLRSRTGHDVTPAYPDLAGLAAAGQMILDGEIVALGGGIRPSFSDLQRRIHVRKPASALQAAVPVTYLAFDLLSLSGRRLLASPYEQRREMLESLGLHLLPGVAVPPSFAGDGPAVLAVSRQHGLEGIVLKRLGSPYVPGRSSLWLKIKHPHIAQVVIGGWIPRGAGRAETVRSLLVGEPGPAGLIYRGQVGTGFTEHARQDLARRLTAAARPRSPFAGDVPATVARRARWVLPLLSGEVGFTEQTPAGHFRHPVWRGSLPGPS
jgi:bifunctional non-homologous end joining protein LigD